MLGPMSYTHVIARIFDSFFFLPIRIIRFTHIGRSRKSHAGWLCINCVCCVVYDIFSLRPFFCSSMTRLYIYNRLCECMSLIFTPKRTIRPFHLFFFFLFVLIVYFLWFSIFLFGWFGCDFCWKSSLLLCIIRTYECSGALIFT